MMLPHGEPRMTDEERIARLEHRVYALQTGVVTIVHHLGIEHQVVHGAIRKLRRCHRRRPRQGSRRRPAGDGTDTARLRLSGLTH